MRGVLLIISRFGMLWQGVRANDSRGAALARRRSRGYAEDGFLVFPR